MNRVPEPSTTLPDKPQRIQLSRVKGWKMPPNTVKVDRSTRWGNPERADVMGARLAVDLFRSKLARGMLGPIHAIITDEVVRRELRGKNLACWCQIGSPCHADVLLEIANAEPPAIYETARELTPPTTEEGT